MVDIHFGRGYIHCTSVLRTVYLLIYQRGSTSGLLEEGLFIHLSFRSTFKSFAPYFSMYSWLGKNRLKN